MPVEIDEVDSNGKKKILNISIYPVTFKEYDLFYEDIGKANNPPSSEGFGRGRNPVIKVSWNDAISYYKWLSEKGNNIYRLLTFDEWMSISNQITFDKNNIWYGEKKVTEVNNLKPNNLGLYHFYGNVHEWCYCNEKEEKIAIGGYFFNTLSFINKKNFLKKSHDYSHRSIGFRIVKEM